MCKQEFLAQLRNELSGLLQDDIQERLTFYSEMIDDRIEEGLSEDEAVAAVGTADEIAAQILADTPLTKLVKGKMASRKRLKVWEIVLLSLGSPIWLSLLIAAFAIVFSVYVSLWSVIISLWAVFASVVGCAFGCTIGGVALTFFATGLSGIATISASLVCAGLSIFLFYGCMAATKGTLLVTKKFALWTKRCFIRKEEA